MMGRFLFKGMLTLQGRVVQAISHIEGFGRRVPRKA